MVNKIIANYFVVFIKCTAVTKFDARMIIAAMLDAPVLRDGGVGTQLFTTQLCQH